eukprot:TRINITY_DN7887_c0_g1_i1.p1 TRINITY_DN7887_c0_g1~~TRINITY_DN7887_c0_g1_i1.p1  ORF type:complete len:207 (-),score=20.40 TRINITY_DN7887_c0_g1_i1:42-662(-)
MCIRDRYQRRVHGHVLIIYNSPAVEIDESLLTHLRVDGTIHERQCWTVGNYDRNTHQTQIIVVRNDHDHIQLHNIILQHVHTQANNPTRVYTDGWLGYSFLDHDPELHYQHFVINHQHGFGLGINTTNHIEGFWAELKKLANFDRGYNLNQLDEVKFQKINIYYIINYFFLIFIQLRYKVQLTQLLGEQTIGTRINNSQFKILEWL